MEPDPPPVMIGDPRGPVGSPDVLAGGREPWRPSRALVAVTLAVALVLTIAGASAWWVRHEHHLDRMAVADVAVFFADLSRPDGGAAFTLSLGNGGTSPVRVLTVELVGIGHAPVRVDKVLTPQAYLPVVLPSADVCSPTLFTKPPSELLVRLRTRRGTELTRAVALTETTASEIGDEQRMLCGFLTPNEALSTVLVDARRVGNRVLADLALWNESALPVTVTGLRPFSGIKATVRLPVTAPAHRAAAVTLRITLQVVDCRRLQRDSPQAGGQDAPDAVLLSLSNGYVESTLSASLLHADGDEAHPENSVYVAPLIQQLCPYVVFGP